MATPNFLDKLRLRNLFGNDPQFGGQVNKRQSLFETPEITIPTNPPISRTPMMDNYRNMLLGGEPNRKDYEQGKIGKTLALVAGGLTGATEGISRGIATGQGILEQPYNRALEDYSNKGGRLRELADLEYKTGLEDRKFGIENRELTLKEIKALSDVNLTDAQIKNLQSQIKNRGMSLQKNEATGMLEVVNINDGTRQSVGKFLETPGEKDTREKGMFGYKYGIEQKGKKELESIRFNHDKALAKLKSDLDTQSNITPTQSNAAFEGALAETSFNNPELSKKIFDTDAKTGNLVLKEKYDPKDYQTFIAKVNQRINAKVGKETNAVNFPTIETPTNTTPQVTNPEDQVLRETAIQAIKEQYPDKPEALTDEETIQFVMEQIRSAANQRDTNFIEQPRMDFDTSGLFRNMNTIPARERVPQGQFRNFGVPTPREPYIAAPFDPRRTIR